MVWPVCTRQNVTVDFFEMMGRNINPCGVRNYARTYYQKYIYYYQSLQIEVLRTSVNHVDFLTARFSFSLPAMVACNYYLHFTLMMFCFYKRRDRMVNSLPSSIT